jgi:hypothetical protein
MAFPESKVPTRSREVDEIADRALRASCQAVEKAINLVLERWSVSKEELELPNPVVFPESGRVLEGEEACHIARAFQSAWDQGGILVAVNSQRGSGWDNTLPVFYLQDKDSGCFVIAVFPLSFWRLPQLNQIVGVRNAILRAVYLDAWGQAAGLKRAQADPSLRGKVVSISLK